MILFSKKSIISLLSFLNLEIRFNRQVTQLTNSTSRRAIKVSKMANVQNQKRLHLPQNLSVIEYYTLAFSQKY